MELTVGTIALAPVIVAVVEGAKKLGLAKVYWPWLTAGLSLAFYALTVFLVQRPDLLEPATIGLNGLVIFLASAGLFDRSQKTLKL